MYLGERSCDSVNRIECVQVPASFNDDNKSPLAVTVSICVCGRTGWKPSMSYTTQTGRSGLSNDANRVLASAVC
jgi:hypothetical protein